MDYRIRRAMACAAGLLGLAAFATVQAATQMLVPPATTGTKAAKSPPGDIRSVAVPVRFNAAALLALAVGDEAELTLPNGTRHAFVFDQKTDHGNGNVTWIGYYRDTDQKRMLRAIVTTGPDGSLGLIQTPAGEYHLRLGSGGNDWLVDSAAEAVHHPPIDLRGDTRRVPARLLQPAEPLAQADFVESIGGLNVPLSSTIPMTTKVLTTPSLVTVDMLVAYNDSLANSVNIDTFIANLLSQANTSYADSKVGIQLRLAGKMRVAYDDATDNNAVLDDITGTAVDNFGNPVPSPLHDALEAQRNALGADMVTFYRGGDGITSGSSGGSGVAWAPTSPMSASWAPYMYSTVQGCWGGCQYIWTHEVGHNMGNMHDRATHAWENTISSSTGGQGSYPYSWGFYSCNGKYDDTVLTCGAFSGGCTSPLFSGKPNCASSTNAYRDLMAYFHESTVLVRRFSNPDLDCPGSAPNLKCGLADGSVDVGGRQDSADTALSMNNNRVALSALRSPPASSATTAAALASNANPARVGMPITYTATVSSSGGTPTGTVAFSLNGVTFAGCGAVAVSGGTATCSTSLGNPGAFSIAAVFTGSGGFANASSNVVAQQVVPVPSLVAATRRGVDFNADLKGDLAWVGPGGAYGLWLMNGNATPAATGLAAPANATLRATGDFNGDGKTDLLWRGADGSYSVSLMNGSAITATTQVLAGGLGWDVIGVADFNGDGKADLLWNSADGQFGVWLMNGAATASAGSLAPPAAGMVPLLLGDLNGDLKTDIVWGAADGSVTLALMNGVAASGTAAVLGGGTGWRPTHLADLNGDGKADIIWAYTDGSVGAWLMNGLAPTSTGSFLGGGTGWSLVFAPDLNGDGKADLVFRHVNGTYMGWIMNGLAATDSRGLLSQTSPVWTLAAIGDYNGDGKWDFMWRHTDGTHAMWLNDGLTPFAFGTVLGANTGWSLAP